MMKRSNRSLGALAALWLSGSPACTQITGLDGPFAPAVDAPCQSSSDCASGTCSGSPGWCTQLCASDADCPSGWCIENSNKVFACFPECGSSADCDAYGVPGLACQPTTTVDGVATTICTR